MTAAWRTSQSPYPKDIQMGSSPTATVAIESRWPCRNTWQRFLEEGTDRELGTKDADLPICSVVKRTNCPPVYIHPVVKVIQIYLPNQWIAPVFFQHVFMYEVKPLK